MTNADIAARYTTAVLARDRVGYEALADLLALRDAALAIAISAEIEADIARRIERFQDRIEARNGYSGDLTATQIAGIRRLVLRERAAA